MKLHRILDYVIGAAMMVPLALFFLNPQLPSFICFLVSGAWLSYANGVLKFTEVSGSRELPYLSIGVPTIIGIGFYALAICLL